MKKKITAKVVNEDTTAINNKNSYGLRIGIDLSKPAQSFVESEFTGFSIVGDFRISPNIFLAAEVGTESTTLEFPRLTVSGAGSFIKGGFNYNFYDNWFGERNLIFVGARLGFATFNQTIESFTVSSQDFLFEQDTRNTPQEFTGLNAFWLEIQVGIQFEVLRRVYVGLNFQIQNRLAETAPDGFQNVFIPDFGEPTEGSSFSVGFGYTVSYFIPFFKK